MTDIRRLGPDDPDMPAVHTLVTTAFAYMDGRVDPPSSIHRTGLAEMRAMAREGLLLAAGRPPLACVFCTATPGALYLGKLAVAEAARGRGLARALVQAAEAEARARGLGALELQTRVELTENHATFARLGFAEVARTAHPGYDRPTSLTMRKELR
ncbi:GNAT family N-acetyltransferase [Paroceanicella profunda]|uniref:GNAT family N-acetyltransferase n=1 Tax=Paroceanicella profunda TaxID=2579971 RepID=A0A5B8FV02_9RHOB|nr:GNAT family N-acetyltransferase [Paroceanicella profunda]QDL91154.1 GNAT family N-acetyltransferase [Paroceanicella profunda]